MEDVIYRQAAIDALTTECSWTFYDEHGQLTPNGEEILGTLKNIPTADVRENVHGEWIDGRRMKMDGTYHWFRECSVCGHERYDANPDKDTDFCPNCGADMRGEDDG